MQVSIIAVGKLKESYLLKGIQEYQKRLQPYAKINIEEIKASPVPRNSHQGEVEEVLQAESNRLFSKLGSPGYLIALDSKGKQFTSEGFASHIHKLMTGGHNKFTFVIGGTLGLSSSIKNQSDLKVSFSKFTFPHQLMRLILMEQIYRCCKIIWKEPYHY